MKSIKLKLTLILFLTAVRGFAQNDSVFIKSASITLDSIYFIKQSEKIEKYWEGIMYNEKYPNFKADYDYEIVDEKSEMKFSIDSTEIYVSAYNKDGKLIWKTDPWIDNKLRVYRHNRPVIVEFMFDKIPSSSTSKKWYPNKDVIWIRYSNSQMGWLDKLTGEFDYFGQD